MMILLTAVNVSVSLIPRLSALWTHVSGNHGLLLTSAVVDNASKGKLATDPPYGAYFVTYHAAVLRIPVSKVSVGCQPSSSCIRVTSMA
jgi:hypothetical protein